MVFRAILVFCGIGTCIFNEVSFVHHVIFRWRCFCPTLLFCHSVLQVISAEGEMKAARRVKEAADILSQQPASIQLRYLQALQGVAEENNHTIVFPLPASLFTGVQNMAPKLLGSVVGVPPSKPEPALVDLGQPEDGSKTQF